MGDKKKHDGTPIPPELWGKDHFSTLVYIESVCVDGRGVPKAAKMRTGPGRLRRGDTSGPPGDYGGEEYPTRLGNGVSLYNHDDWDCVDDMIEVGLVVAHGTGLNPVFDLTPAGWMVAGMVRRHLARMGLRNRRGYAGFNMDLAIRYAKNEGDAVPCFELPELPK